MGWGGSHPFLIFPSVMQDEFDKYDEPRLHMERLMKTHLIEFDISMRILIPLEESGIRTLGDLVKQTRDSLMKIRMIGCNYVDQLERFLSNLDLKLAQ